ncbi:MAG: nitroreductase [Halobacillus sp.]|uniref:nitroreductase family protein n=1 Tax=Halobacillus sp. TaxID=56800 RepID=UPI003BB070FD
MELVEAIKNRRSIHDFKQEEVPVGLLKEIFTSASWAPTHRMKEPWNIYMFQEEGKQVYANLVLQSYTRKGFFEGYSKEKSQRMKQGIHEFLENIPHHALIFMEKDANEHKYEEDYAAVCAFIQNVQLLAWEKGIGGLWTTSPYLHDAEFIKGVGLNPVLHKLIGVIQMGYPEKVPKAKPRTSMEDKYTLFNYNFTNRVY